MSRSRESPDDACSTLHRPTNKVGIVEILLAVLFVFLLFQLARFDQQHIPRIHGDETPTLALQ
jgi:hypothetical protein